VEPNHIKTLQIEKMMINIKSLFFYFKLKVYFKKNTLKGL